ncbi:MAG: PaaI family thioesterase [Hyphomonadaceae bacterium]|jgi:uncharacterized protein (TIGR00369 family)|nr:PaaI family thioesterase [Hyphomonadaceae bacterium]
MENTPDALEDAAREAFAIALREHRPDFEVFFLARLFGLEFSYPGETCIVRFPVRRFMFNPQGALHGGVTSFVLDVAMGHLLRHAFGTPGVTLELKTQYLAPIREPEARCEARFLRKGKTICFLEARLLDSEGIIAATATSTWRVLRPTE